MVKRDNGRPGTFKQEDPTNDNASKMFSDCGLCRDTF